MARRPLTASQIGERGGRLYGERIQGTVEDEHRGKMLVLELASGDYEIDPDGREAALRLQLRRPGADLYRLKIGYPAAGRIGRQLLDDAG